MAEGRMIKKVICTSKKLSALKTDTARLLYTWMLPHLDIEGRFSGDPDVIKGYVVPRVKSITAETIQGCLLDMQENKLILLYDVDGDVFLQFTKFEEHQTLRRDREAESIIPQPTPGVPPDKSGSKPAKVKLREVKINEYSEDSFSYKTAKKLYDLILERNPTHKLPNLQSWAEEIDKMVRIDKRPEDGIEAVLLWSQQDSFWQNNIYCTEKLRKQYDKLYLKMNTGKRTQPVYQEKTLEELIS